MLIKNDLTDVLTDQECDDIVGLLESRAFEQGVSGGRWYLASFRDLIRKVQSAILEVRFGYTRGLPERTGDVANDDD